MDSSSGIPRCKQKQLRPQGIRSRLTSKRSRTRRTAFGLQTTIDLEGFTWYSSAHSQLALRPSTPMKVPALGRYIRMDGGSDEDATRSADQGEQMDGGNLKKRWRQPEGKERTEMKKEAKTIEVYLRKVRYLFRNRAQIEEGGNEGAVQ